MNDANFPARFNPNFAASPATSLTSLNDPFTNDLVNFPTNLPIPVPNLKYNAKRVGQ
jgi:hypothetical protein